MKNQIEKLRQAALTDINEANDLASLEATELKYFGRKEGQLTLILKQLKDLSETDKKEVGQLANKIKNELETEIATQKKTLSKKQINESLARDVIDTSLPGIKPCAGSLNPNTFVQNELEDIFRSLGFMILDGPELESDYFNFEALNIPEHHPARDIDRKSVV